MYLQQGCVCYDTNASILTVMPMPVECSALSTVQMKNSANTIKGLYIASCCDSEA